MFSRDLINIINVSNSSDTSSLGSCSWVWWLKETWGSQVHLPALPGAGPSSHCPFQENTLNLYCSHPMAKYSTPCYWHNLISHYIISHFTGNSKWLFLSAVISQGPYLSLSTQMFATVFKVGTYWGEKPVPPTEMFFQSSHKSIK